MLDRRLGRAHLNQRLRQVYIETVGQDSRRRLGRGLTAEELERVLRRYPGDMAYRRREQPVESIRYFAREIEGGGAEPGVVLTVMTDA
jgi:hypothetical protein